MAVKDRVLRIGEGRIFHGTAAPPPPPPPPPPGSNYFRTSCGFYGGPTNPKQGILNFEAAYSVTCKYPMHNLDVSSASALKSSAWFQFDSTSAGHGSVAPWLSSDIGTRIPVVSVPLATGDVNLASASTGGLDDAWTYACNRVKDVVGVSGVAMFRVGWEFDGSWMKWAISSSETASNGQEANYIAAFRRFVGIARGILTNSQFNQCGSSKYFFNRFTPGYAGDAYVDSIGIDNYNQSFEYSSSTSTATRQYVQDHYFWDDLDLWVTFATTHGKKVAFPEWGTPVSGDASQGGGDDTVWFGVATKLWKLGTLDWFGNPPRSGHTGSTKTYASMQDGTRQGFHSYWDSNQGGDFFLNDNPNVKAAYIVAVA